jgi:hypothetical protein
VKLGEREIAQVLGLLLSGNEVPPDERRAALAALRGITDTADAGERLYYVQVDTCLLPNVDEDEAIWSTGADGMVLGRSLADEAAAYALEVVPLCWLGDRERLTRVAARWTGDADGERAAAWAAFMRRIGEPLLAMLDSAS